MAVGNPISLTDNVASRIISQIATESQTDFTISGGYRLNAISVYRNGVRLVSGRDYSAADGSTVVLLSGASLSDVLEFHIFDDFRVADALVSNASHQNIEGNLTIAGILTVTTLDLSSLTVSDSISIGGTLTYEDVTNVDSIGIVTARTDLHVGAGLSVVGVSTFTGNAIFSGDVDLGSGTSDTITIAGKLDGHLIPTNDDQKDIGSSSLQWKDLYVDGTGNIDSLVSGDGTFSTSLGIGTANPSNYGSDIKLALSSSGDTNLSIGAGVGKTSNVFFADGTSGDDRYRGSIKYAHDTDSMRFHTAATERLRITSDGKVGINSTSPTADLEIVGTTGTATTAFINAPVHSSSVASEAVLKFGYAHSGSPDAAAEIKLVEGSTNSFGGHLTFSVPDNNGSGGSSTSEKLRITSGGLVGIGTDNPQGILHVSDGANGLEFNVNNQNAIVSYDRVNTVYRPNGLQGSTVSLRIGGVGTALHVHSDGKVGINETSPDVRLHVKEQFDKAYSLANMADEANHLLKLENPSTTANAFAGMQFRVGSGADMFFGAIQQSVNHGDFFFGNQNSTNTELMRIKSTGSIGIGTDNPGSLVDIASGDLEFSNKSNSSAIQTINFSDGTQGRGKIRYLHDGDNLTFHTFSDERLRIASNGQVLIGNYDTHSAIHGNLEVNGNDGINISNADRTDTNGAQWRLIPHSGGSNTNAATNLRLYEGAGGTEVLNIQKAGQVMIGHNEMISHPNMDDLQIGDANGNRGITISSGTSNYGSVCFGDSTDGSGTDRYEGFIEYYHDDDSMRLGTVHAEKLRITSGGSIGISSTAPKTDVDISQKTGAVALPQGTTAQRPSGSSPYIRYNTTNSALEFYNGTDWVEIITDYFPTGSTTLG